MPAGPPWRRISRQTLRFVPLAAGLAALLVGLASGLVRIGWQLPLVTDASLHAPLMICGFFGTLISLERAVALGRLWHYLAPASSAIGALALIGDSVNLAAAAFLLAGIALAFTSVMLFIRVPALFTALLAAAALSWVLGTAAWMAGRSASDASGWWLTFLVLTIAAERLELSRVTRLSILSQAAFTAAVVLVLTGAAWGELLSTPAIALGSGFLLIAAWLVTCDIARRTVHQQGQVRFTAICLLSGYVWLGVAGLAVLIPWRMFSYDIAVHAIAIGFVLSMVYGHAPIILPAVIGVRVRYQPAAYAALALLHASVLLRVVGDLADIAVFRTTSGAATVLALLSYAATLFVGSQVQP